MAEKPYLNLSEATELPLDEIERLTEGRTPFFCDEYYAFYRCEDGRIVMRSAPNQSDSPGALTLEYIDPHEEYKQDFSKILVDAVDKKILEAGFATEPHRQLIEELADALGKRMFENGRLGFTNHEYQLLQRAAEIAR